MKLKLVAIGMLLLFICSACGKKSKDELLKQGVILLDSGNPNGAVVLFKSALEKDINYLDARYQLAKAYAALGKFDQAEKEFMKVLKQNPSRDEVLLDLAAVYCSTKKTDEAFKLGEQYLVKHPGSVEGLEVLGVASAAAKKYDEAEHYLLQAMSVNNSRIKTKLELASVYVSSGKEKSAKSLLEEIIRTAPKAVRASYMLAAIETATGNVDRALDIYKNIVRVNSAETLASYKSGLIYIEKVELDRADKIADDLLQKFPKRADGYRLKGLIYYQRKNFTEASANFQTSIKIAPTLEAYYFLGLCHYNRGEFESALSQFRRILNSVPNSRQARLMTATVLISQKRIDDAITEIQKVLQINDEDAVAHNLLGNAYMVKGLFAEGIREFNRATKIDPKIVDAYLKKGYFYFSRGKNAEGEAELATAVHAAPDVQNSRLLLASYYLKSGNSTKALAVLNAGLTGKKSDAPILNGLAAVCFSQNKQDEGIRYIQKAKTMDPELTSSYQNLATVYIAKGNYDKAVGEYTTLLKNVPQNLTALLGLAALYEITGNDTEALVYYQKGIDTKQSPAFIAKASYHLKKQETAKAIKTLDEALKNDSRNLMALEMKGRILISEKKYKDAIRVFEDVESINPDAGIALKIGAYVSKGDTAKAVEQARRIIEKSPGSARGYMVLGSIYESQKDYIRAIGEVKNGVRIDGNNAQAILYLGNLYEIIKDYRQAMSLYIEAYRKKTDFVPALFAQGALFDATGKKKEAIDKYRAVLEKSNLYVPALNNLAYLYAAGYGNTGEALRLAVSAFKQDPGNAGTMDTLGFALLRNNRAKEAIKVLEKASGLLPNNPTVSYHLSLAYKEAGDRKKALRVAQKALSFGEFSDAKAVAALVAELKR